MKLRNYYVPVVVGGIRNVLDPLRLIKQLNISRAIPGGLVAYPPVVVDIGDAIN
jgi:hypothetical protein